MRRRAIVSVLGATALLAASVAGGVVRGRPRVGSPDGPGEPVASARVPVSQQLREDVITVSVTDAP